MPDGYAEMAAQTKECLQSKFLGLSVTGGTFIAALGPTVTANIMSYLLRQKHLCQLCTQSGSIWGALIVIAKADTLATQYVELPGKYRC